MTLINDGGFFFMIPLVLLLAITIALFVKGLFKNTQKNIELLKSFSLFALVFGFLGFIIGVINALDAVNGNVAPTILAGGIKRGLLPPVLGTLVFLIGRFSVIVLIGIQKNK